MDLSSPRATLNSFMNAGAAAYLHLSEIYHGTPTRALVHRQLDLGTKMARTFDMSGIPPAIAWDVGVDGIIYLYEILSRIKLPAAEDIPDATAYTATENNNNTDDEPATLTIPHTEITLVRITEGPQQGQFLFSSPTILRAGEFYQKIH